VGVAEAPALYPARPSAWQYRSDIHPGWRYLARGLRILLETIAPALIVALVINLFIAQATRVHGQSMEPTLHSDQRLVVEKLSYNNWLHLRSPQRGDVVVLRINGMDELLIKRVIGLPGDQVEIRHGQVFINHQMLDEPYVVFPAEGDYGPVDVPPLHLFVLGDNRNFSNDSRTFGPIPMKNVVGRAWFSYWPPETLGPVQ
jgi:signal peptidase I